MQLQKQSIDKNIIKLSEVVPIEKEQVKHIHHEHKHDNHARKHDNHTRKHDHREYKPKQPSQPQSVQPPKYIPPHLRTNYKPLAPVDNDTPKKNNDGWKTVTRKH